MLDCSKSKTCHGVILIVVGSILLLNVLGILKETTGLVISAAGIIMLGYGFMLCNGPEHIKKLFKKNTK